MLLTNEQYQALQSFADAHGRYWRSDLRAAWANGKDERLPDAGLLRQVRNCLGVNWLYGSCRIKPRKPS